MDRGSEGPSLCGSPLGWAFGCSTRGASHLRNRKPCQDAVALWSGTFLAEPLMVLAVADGHGDRRHDLSHLGAALAVDAGVEEVIQSLSAATSGDPVAPSIPLTARVTDRWARKVLADAAVPGDKQGDPHPILTRYGTTLLLAVVTRERILLAQLGDGDILMVRPDGRVETPVEKDPALLGSVTHSLSSRNVQECWHTAELPAGSGGILMLATDGLSDSFAGPGEEEFQMFARSLVDRIHEYGIERVAGSLPGWLDSFSRDGSGDDITVALAWLEPEKIPAPAEGQGSGTGAANTEGDSV
ncbi:MAG: protein phosphatase 2C domain-containing protein [Methanomicrobiales archaeon]|nr:protein phosphatase 2C domain-containing protein [Methanomicrobiales archaeon]